MKIRVFTGLLAAAMISGTFLTPKHAFAATSAKCPGEEGYIYTNDRNSRNPRKGGFVSNSAFAGDHVFIAPTAAVCGSASVVEYARVYGHAVVADEAEVTDRARVFGNARIEGTAVIAGQAKVSDHATVKGDAIVEGVAWIRGWTVVSSGHFTEGTQNSPKPQSIIDAEKRDRAREIARQQRERDAEKAREKARLLKEQKAKHELDGEKNLRRIAHVLASGDYYAVNPYRHEKHQYGWAVKNTNYDRCSVELKRIYGVYALKTGNSVRQLRTSLHTINLWNTGLRTTTMPDHKPGYCLKIGYDDNYLCFRNANKPVEIINDVIAHRKAYCSGGK